MAVRACASLAGYGSIPENRAVQSSLGAMLTPYMARKMSREQPCEVRGRNANPTTNEVACINVIYELILYFNDKENALEILRNVQIKLIAIFLD